MHSINVQVRRGSKLAVMALPSGTEMICFEILRMASTVKTNQGMKQDAKIVKQGISMLCMPPSLVTSLIYARIISCKACSHRKTCQTTFCDTHCEHSACSILHAAVTSCLATILNRCFASLCVPPMCTYKTDCDSKVAGALTKACTAVYK